MRERPVVVVDTNVFISAILFGGRPLELLNYWRTGAFDLALSPELLAEVLTKLRSKFGLPGELVAEWRDLLEAQTLRVLPEYRTTICRDPEDNKVLDTAAAARAACVVTGDKDLLEIGSFRGVRILGVAALLGELAQ